MSVPSRFHHRGLPRSYLLRSAICLGVCQSPWLTQLASYIVSTPSAPIQSLVKHTVFPHFCAGEDPEGLKKTVDFLQSYNLKVIVGHVAEEYRHGGQTPPYTLCLSEWKDLMRTFRIPTCVKLSSMVPGHVLRSPDARERYPWVWKKVVQALMDVGELAKTYETKLLIDAEQSYYQGNIDAMLLEIQRELNRGGSVTVFNTYQMYLRNGLNKLKQHVHTAERDGFAIGAKLVRGAYLEEEMRIRPRDVLPCIQNTHEQYDESVRFMLGKHLDPHETILATHNPRSIKLAEHLLQDTLANPTVGFAQLMGMGDHLSLGLAERKFRVYKYAPYGNMQDSMPYLLRRLQENRSIVSHSPEELRSILMALVRS